MGYKGPKTARGLHPSGYKEVIVHNLEELSKVDKDLQAARIAHSVGKRKRAQILASGRKLKIVILNARETPKGKETEEEPEAAKTADKPEEKSQKPEQKEKSSKKPEKQKKSKEESVQ